MFILLLLFQFTVTTGQYSNVTVRHRDDVTLTCGNVTDDQNKCYSTTWIFSVSGKSTTVTLFELGQIKKDIVKSKSNRLSVTENCSLVIKKVTAEDVGRYTCRQQKEDSMVDLSVVTINKVKDNNKITMICIVLSNGLCRHTVKWIYEGNNSIFTDVETSHSYCSAFMKFKTSHRNQKYSDLLKCEVTDGHRRKQQFPFRRQTSGEEATKSTTTTETTTSKSKLIMTNTTRLKSTTTITEATSAQTNTRNYSIKRDPTEPQGND
ncbi:uncharacterized protein LOC117152835 [Anabas testudineus]|uniref:uncharacterized protein LOC117152835 n=1 Tax=Anabas testudineus TaxID=64144 RepID=UPI00143D691A|nr:uncharacterized protein LOC117152835 [Anabas testudineus]